MDHTKETFDFSRLSHQEIQRQLEKLNIPLAVEEALKIQNEMLKRPPTLTELILFSIEGSEHCSYKSSRSHLKQFNTTGPNVVLGAKEDAGVIAVTKDNQGNRYCVVISHESHNHPSQIVPYEGAATGIGGNVRDVMCMGAEVIAVTDGLRFGDISSSKTKWIHEGVVAGIAGYANPLGIPNIGGDLYYDQGYNDNCLVTIVTLGIVREDEILHSFAPDNADDYDIILVGKATDNSGFGGASFASLELEEEKKEKNKGAVQEPNAFLERHLLKSSYSLFKKLKSENLLERVGFKDLGAGGIACASVELAETADYGAEIWLERVPTCMSQLHPSVILCSETQERFMWVVPPELSQLVLDHYNRKFELPEISELAQACIIGKIRNDQKYVVHYQNKKIVNAPASEVTRGFLYQRDYQQPNMILDEPDLPEPDDYENILLELLAHENIASRLPVFESYDKQVQGRSVIEAGQGDAGVIAPFNDQTFPKEIRNVGIALATDHNPRYGKISPYWAAVNAVVESVRNIAAVGATPQAITDCLCFGNPEKPEQMWEFVESTRGVSEACNAIHLKELPEATLPIVAGNVSFYNESKKGAIPASPIISCIGVLDDVMSAVFASFQKTDSIIVLVGERRNECGGSAYYALHDRLGENLPKPDLQEVESQAFALNDAIKGHLVLSAHDISDGGVAVALAEMCFRNKIGFQADIPGDLRLDQLLFSETGGFVIETSIENYSALASVFIAANIKFYKIGKTTAAKKIILNNRINIPLYAAYDNWHNGLRDKLL
ncbi:phosphoribosylformylglycinamidine synthase subunit PurL [Candidatus Neomarinimicrobiota bacterium]